MTKKRPQALDCGCTDRKFCRRHWDALTAEERRAHLASLPADRVNKT